MPTNKFTKTVAYICCSLLLVVVLLSLALYNSGPRVRLVNYSHDLSVASLSKNSTIVLTLDRPIQQVDYNDLVEIRPSVSHEVITGSQSITIRLLENLNHSTQYKLNLKPNLYDTSGKKMSDEFTEYFSTTAPKYAYIERNYGSDLTSGTLYAPDADDYIKYASLGQEPEILMSHPEIRTLAANDRYAIAAVKEFEGDTLVSIDLKSRQIFKHSPLINGRIENLVIGQRGQIALFTVRPDYGTVNQQEYEQIANHVEALDIASGEIWNLDNGSGDYINAYELSLDIDGQVALIQDAVQAYFAVSPYNDYAPVLIGTHTSSYGFNDSSSEIVFRDQDNFSRYQVASGKLEPVDLIAGDYVYQVSNKADSIFVSTVDYFSGKPRTQIFEYADWGLSPITVWDSTEFESLTFSSFSENYSGTLLAINLIPGECTYDDIGANSQCQNSVTIIYDTINKKVVEELKGFDLLWLP